jgi:hypothetical protein
VQTSADPGKVRDWHTISYITITSAWGWDNFQQECTIRMFKATHGSTKKLRKTTTAMGVEP